MKYFLIGDNHSFCEIGLITVTKRCDFLLFEKGMKRWPFV